MGMSLWHLHPGVRSGAKQAVGERAADLVRNGMGSWPFVLAFLAFMVLWAVLNGGHGIDPYPYILLNLFLSMIVPDVVAPVVRPPASIEVHRLSRGRSAYPPSVSHRSCPRSRVTRDLDMPAVRPSTPHAVRISVGVSG
jgi:hypothetical protein